jgi:HPt (histidine-containing phosphotransfer) domain-containing protein
MATEPLIDPATWRELQDTAGAEFAVELADTFLEEGPGLLAELGRAATAGDAEAFRRAAHSLKSNGQTFGAGPLAQAARTLELGTMVQGDAAALAALQAIYEASAAALKALAHG